MQASIIALICGVAFCSFGVWHEYRWRIQRKHWLRCGGFVVGVAELGEGDHAEVEYLFKGKRIKFVSAYSGCEVGAEVTILYDPDSGEAEVVSYLNRWVFTLFPCVIGLAAIYAFFAVK